MLTLASITDKILNPVVNVATDFISSAGLPAVFILMTLESACIPVPSEAIMLFAGFSVSNGDLTLTGIVVAGVLGNLAGSWIAYAVGYYGRLELLERHHVFHVNPKHLRWAESWFERHGEATVFFARMLPIIRTFISLPAGVARMPFWRFTGFTLAGCVPWVLMLAIVGREVGDNWEKWRHNLAYLDYLVLVAVVGLVVYLILRRRRDDGPGEGEAAEGSEEGDAAEAASARGA